MKLKRMVKHTLALSGTPITNRPIELFTTIKMLAPQLFGSKFEFAQEFCNARHNGFGWDFSGAKNTEKLHKILTESIMIRRLKADVLKDLPAKMRSVVPVEITNRNIYVKAESNFIDYLKKIDPEKAKSAERAETLVQIEGLKQLTIEGKIKACKLWIKEHLETNGKLVVFCTHKSTINYLMDEFKDIAVKLDITNGIVFTNANIAQVYYELGEYHKGLDLCEKTLEMVQENQMARMELNIYQDLIKFYQILGNYKKAYLTSENYRKLSDSLALDEQEKHITELETRYQTHLKEDTIDAQKAQIKEERTFIWFLSVIIFLILASLIIIFRLFILKHKSLKNLVKAHKELTSKNAQILNLIPCQPQNQASDLNQNNNFIYQKAYSYLITDRNFLDEYLSLEKLSSAIRINREYIRNAIKDIEDCNFKTFLNNQRIDYAKKLILDDVMNQLSIEEIAHQSGFSSRTSFYRTFRESTGFTPAFYKSQLQKNAVSAN
jgi:YesN/AraC family two-component response regulator